jgi:SOS response regulatory protein OraA/RecX
MTAALPLALLCGLSLASAALSFLALVRSRLLAGMGERKARAETGQLGATVETIQKAVESLSQEVRELRQHAPGTTLDGGVPKPGLNLSKRSQALRMHRRGETPEQIAAALVVSRQEVDLLLKVHRIVMARC